MCEHALVVEAPQNHEQVWTRAGGRQGKFAGARAAGGAEQGLGAAAGAALGAATCRTLTRCLSPSPRGWLGEPRTAASAAAELSPIGKPEEMDLEPFRQVHQAPALQLGVWTHRPLVISGGDANLVWSKPGVQLLLSFHFCLSEEKGCQMW